MLETLDRSALSAEQRDFYHEQGYLVLREFFPTDLMAEASAEADALLRRRDLIAVENLRCRWQPNVQTGACEFETFDPVIDLAPVCRRIAYDARLLAALAALYGEEACLFKDKLIFKPPGVKGYGLHQDWIAWPGFPRSFLTVLVPFDRADADNGCTQVFPGYHMKGCLVARGRPVSRIISGPDRRDARRPPGTGTWRRGSLRLLHAAPFRSESLRPLASPVIRQL